MDSILAVGPFIDGRCCTLSPGHNTANRDESALSTEWCPVAVRTSGNHGDALLRQRNCSASAGRIAVLPATVGVGRARLFKAKTRLLTDGFGSYKGKLAHRGDDLILTAMVLGGEKTAAEFIQMSHTVLNSVRGGFVGARHA